MIFVPVDGDALSSYSFLTSLKYIIVKGMVLSNFFFFRNNGSIFPQAVLTKVKDNSMAAAAVMAIRRNF